MLLDALRQTQARAVVSSVAAREVPEVVQPVRVPAVASAPLPDDVVSACELFGFGDREEVSRNFRRAGELHAMGRTSADIVREIRQGADVSGLFV